MATYVVLMNWTSQGIATIKDAPQRMAAARDAAKAVGVELTQILVTMGRYDLVAIAEAPDDETAAKLTLAVAGLGNVRTETLRAFTPEEFRGILDALP